jgi:hypothetical protein
MYSVRDSDNNTIIKTADLDLAELVVLACSLARGRFHKVLDEAGTLLEFDQGQGPSRNLERAYLHRSEITI